MCLVGILLLAIGSGAEHLLGRSEDRGCPLLLVRVLFHLLGRSEPVVDDLVEAEEAVERLVAKEYLR